MMRSLGFGISCCLLSLAACANGSGGTGDGGVGANPDAIIRAQEGHACSTTPDDDPQLVCTTAQDLVCITTYSRAVTDPQQAAKYDGGLRPVFVCRFPCATSADCAQQGDICCPGSIFGKTFGKAAACVPPGSCEAIPPDGGS